MKNFFENICRWLMVVSKIFIIFGLIGFIDFITGFLNKSLSGVAMGYLTLFLASLFSARLVAVISISFQFWWLWLFLGYCTKSAVKDAEKKYFKHTKTE